MTYYDKYKPSGINWIGDIPSHWGVKKLKFIADIETGTTPSKSNDENYNEDGLVWVKPDNLNGLTPISDSKEKISPKGIKGIRLIPKDSVLVCGIGTIGKFGIAGCDLATNQQINSILFNSNIKVDFGKYLIASAEQELLRNSNKVVVSILTKTAQKEISFPVPNIDEQTAIAKYLDEKTAQIDTLITNKQKLIELLKEEIQGLINEALLKGINRSSKFKPSGNVLLGDIPSTWMVRRVSTFGDFFKGKGIKKDEIKDVGLPCIRYGELYTKYDRVVYNPTSYIDIETTKKSELIRKGDVLFAGSGETIEDIGKAVVYYGDTDAYAGGDIIVLRLLDGIDALYVSYLMNASFVQFQKSIAAKGEIIVHIYPKNIREIITPIPPIEEQSQIVDYLDKHSNEIHSAISKIEKEIELMQEYRTALISEVVTGKIKVL